MTALDAGLPGTPEHLEMRHASSRAGADLVQTYYAKNAAGLLTGTRR